MAAYPQSVSYVRTFKMIDSADHFSKKTGLTPTVNISKNGGAFGAAAGVVAEIANGWYKVTLSTADTDTQGDLDFYITATGADDTDFVDQVTDPVRGLAGPTALPATGTLAVNPTLAGVTHTGAVIPTVTNLTNLPSIPANWLTAAGIAAAALNGKGDWNIGKTGYALSAAGIQAFWDALTSALTTVGSVGKLIVDNLNATVSSRAAATLFTGITSVAEWLGLLAGKQVGNATARTEIRATGAGAGTFDETTDSQEAIRDKETDIETDTAEIGVAGAGLSNINLPNQTMDIVGNITGNLSGSVGSVTGAVGSLTTNNDKTGYALAVGGIGAGVIAAAELNAIADAFLDRNMATGTDSGTDSTAVRTVRQALRLLRNKRANVAGVVTVRKEDDVTASWTAAVGTTAGDPTSSIDPT